MTSLEPLEPLVYLEECVGGEWTRMLRFGVALHPAHGKAVLGDRKRIHKSRKFRLVALPDEDIPF